MAHLPPSSNVQIDGFRESRDQRGKTNTKGGIRSPIYAAPVLVDSTTLVEFMDVKLSFLDQVVVRDHNASQGSHEVRVAR